MGNSQEASKDWIKVCGSSDINLEQEVRQKVLAKILEGEFTDENIRYIDKIDIQLAKKGLTISEERLEKLRSLCQIWYVDLKQGEITSHRKYIGPIIVNFKKALFPIFRFFMKDFLRQQRSFNARAVSLLADLCNENSNKES